VITRVGILDLTLGRSQHHGSTSKGTPLNFSRNRSWVWKIGDFQRLSYLWNGARCDPSYYWSLIGICTRAFDWYQNWWPWVTLKGNNSLCYILRLPKIWTKIDPYTRTTSGGNVAQRLYFVRIRVMPIIVGVRWIGGIKWEWGSRKLPFLLPAVAISVQSSYMRPKLLSLSM